MVDSVKAGCRIWARAIHSAFLRRTRRSGATVRGGGGGKVGGCGGGGRVWIAGIGKIFGCGMGGGGKG